MYSVVKKSKRWASDLVEYIERESGYTIPSKARESVQKELEASIRINGQVSQSYINNLVKAYRFAAKVQNSDPATPLQAAGSQVNNM